MRALCLGLLVACLWSYHTVALARVERFAVLVGNDHGLPGDMELRYAEADARRVADVLQELGGFEPANTVLLVGQDASTVQRTLITVNERIRATMSQPDTEVMLFVYYSGHADAESLHLRSSPFKTHELAQLVRGSAATFRLLVVDACRSGQLIRSKGGTMRPPFPLDQDAQLAGEGLAFLTASSENEDAQESDALKGSFFTHALVSGLLGAADQDADGSVVLEEAYRYAYDATLRSTSRTSYGTQHPTFQYDLKGQGRLVLTHTRLAQDQRGTLSLAAGLDVLLFRGSASGPVVAEVMPGSRARSLNLAAGPYFVRVRGSEYLLEGTVTVSAGTSTQLNAEQLSRIQYARLVRKGEGTKPTVHALEVGARVRTTLPNAETPCAGAVLGYRLDLERASIVARTGYCMSRFESPTVQARVHEVDLGARVGHAWDLSWLTLELGGGGSLVGFLQDFQSLGRAPSRRALGGSASAFLSVLYEVKRGFYLGLDVEALVYVFRLRESADESLRAEFAGRSALVAGKHF